MSSTGIRQKWQRFRQALLQKWIKMAIPLRQSDPAAVLEWEVYLDYQRVGVVSHNSLLALRTSVATDAGLCKALACDLFAGAFRLIVHAFSMTLQLIPIVVLSVLWLLAKYEPQQFISAIQAVNAENYVRLGQLAFTLIFINLLWVLPLVSVNWRAPRQNRFEDEFFVVVRDMFKLPDGGRLSICPVKQKTDAATSHVRHSHNRD